MTNEKIRLVEAKYMNQMLSIFIDNQDDSQELNEQFEEYKDKIMKTSDITLQQLIKNIQYFVGYLERSVEIKIYSNLITPFKDKYDLY